MSEQVIEQAAGEQELQPMSGAELRAKSRHLVIPPSGNRYLMRKVSIAVLCNAETLPENFVAETIRNINAEAQEGDEQQPSADDEQPRTTDKDIAQVEAAARIMITASMIQPRIVEKAEAPDEIEYGDVPPDDQNYLYAWLKGKVPDVFVEISGGKVSVGALHTFPDGPQREEDAISGPVSEARGSEPV